MWVHTYFSIRPTTRVNCCPQSLLHPFPISSSQAPINGTLVNNKYDQAHCNNAHQRVLQHRRILLHQVQGNTGLLHMILPVAHSHQDHRWLTQSITTLTIPKSRKRLKLQLWNGKARPFMLQYITSVTSLTIIRPKYSRWVSFGIIPSQLSWLE